MSCLHHHVDVIPLRPISIPVLDYKIEVSIHTAGHVQRRPFEILIFENFFVSGK